MTRYAPSILTLAGILALLYQVTASADPAGALAALLLLVVIVPLFIGALVRVTPRESSGSIVPGRTALAPPAARRSSAIALSSREGAALSSPPAAGRAGLHLVPRREARGMGRNRRGVA